MKINKIPYAVILIAMVITGCSLSNTQAATPTESDPIVIPTDTMVPTGTEALPTNTEIPPTETPVPVQPIEVVMDQLADDGCTLVQLNTAGWNPLSASYTAGGDPFFQFHDNEDGFYFNIELYTVYGAGWTGQLGTYAANCNSNGICIYLVPDDNNAYLATSGEITIESLSQSGGVLQKPVNLLAKNLTLMPVPGSNSQGCFHVDQVSVIIEN